MLRHVLDLAVRDPGGLISFTEVHSKAFRVLIGRPSGLGLDICAGNSADKRAFQGLSDNRQAEALPVGLGAALIEGLVGGEGFAIDASVVKADAARSSAIPGAAMDQQAFGPAQASRAVREYLEGVEVEGRPETQRKSISATDPAAEWTCAPGGPAFFAYSTNYLVDVRYGVIVDVEATSAHRPKEVHAMRTMIERVENRFAIKPTRLIGDMAYGIFLLKSDRFLRLNYSPHRNANSFSRFSTLRLISKWVLPARLRVLLPMFRCVMM